MKKIFNTIRSTPDFRVNKEKKLCLSHAMVGHTVTWRFYFVYLFQAF